MKPVFIAAVIGVPLLAGGLFFPRLNFFAPPPPEAMIAATDSPGVGPLRSEIRTAILKVDGMWCPSCPYIVRQVLLGTPGVVDAKVSLQTKSAVVTYDPSRTKVEDLIAATTNYGYPSRVDSSASAVR